MYCRSGCDCEFVKALYTLCCVHAIIEYAFMKPKPVLCVVLSELFPLTSIYCRKCLYTAVTVLLR